jgi:hypothetical protein
MVRISITASLLLCAAFVAAGPIERESFVSVPMTKLRPATPPTSKTLIEADKARFSKFKGTATQASGSATATNQVDQYLIAVQVGSQTFANMIIDTGSSNTWVGAGTKFSAGSTGKSTGKSVEVSYGSGSFSGTEYTDTVRHRLTLSRFAKRLIVFPWKLGLSRRSHRQLSVDWCCQDLFWLHRH